MGIDKTNNGYIFNSGKWIGTLIMIKQNGIKFGTRGLHIKLTP